MRSMRLAALVAAATAGLGAAEAFGALPEDAPFRKGTRGRRSGNNRNRTTFAKKTARRKIARASRRANLRGRTAHGKIA